MLVLVAAIHAIRTAEVAHDGIGLYEVEVSVLEARALSAGEGLTVVFHFVTVDDNFIVRDPFGSKDQTDGLSTACFVLGVGFVWVGVVGGCGCVWGVGWVTSFDDVMNYDRHDGGKRKGNRGDKGRTSNWEVV